MQSPERITRSRSTTSLSSPIKRMSMLESSDEEQPAKKQRQSPKSPSKSPTKPATIVTPSLTGPPVDVPSEIHMELSFDYNEAKRNNLVNPFRSLCTSILGQQVSWLAARAITHRFIRLYFPTELPEKYEPGLPQLFPTPLQVLETSYDKLRLAGLSGRKAEYIGDLAARFADGRLSAEKLIKMTGEDVLQYTPDLNGQTRKSKKHLSPSEELGHGLWQDMFSMFTLRRPDVLGPGDLGLQKGLIRWFGYDNPTILPAKLSKPVEVTDQQITPPSSPIKTEGEEVSVVSPATPASIRKSELPDVLLSPVTPSRSKSAKVKEENAVTLPFPPAPPFPESATLTREKLRARLSKKIKGNIYLSPAEMEELTAAWRPLVFPISRFLLTVGQSYRTIGMWYLWTLADGPDASV